MATYQIKDDGDPRKYYFQIPNLIDDLGLSVYAFRLYGHLKRVTGDEGKCWQSTRTLARECKISTASVSRAKQELLAAGLIQITGQKTEHGGMDYHEITIVDIWAWNMTSYSEKQQVTGSNLQVTQSNLQVSPQKLASYSGAIKEEPIKNNPLRTSSPPKNGGAGAGDDALHRTHSFWSPEILRLAQTFASVRGCGMPALSRKSDFAQVTKRWKDPLIRILDTCGEDIDQAERLIELTVKSMVGRLTFSAPDQIMKTAESIHADLNSGKLQDSGIQLTEMERTMQTLASMNPLRAEDINDAT